MPNHIKNRLTIEAPRDQHAAILARYCDENAPNFERIVPVPGVYLGSCSSVHDALFGREHCFIDGCRAAWGTKWGAYCGTARSDDDRLVLEFQTAWNAPHPVVLEIAKTVGVPMLHEWCCEGLMTWGWLQYDATGHTAQIACRDGVYRDQLDADNPTPVTADEMYARLWPERANESEE